MTRKRDRNTEGALTWSYSEGGCGVVFRRS